MTGTGRANVRLRDSMRVASMTFADLAGKTGCHIKTAQRWVYEGRIPHRRVAERVAELLGEPVTWLWPTVQAGPGCQHQPLELRLRLSDVRASVDSAEAALWIRTDMLVIRLATPGRVERGDVLAAEAIAARVAAYRDMVRALDGQPQGEPVDEQPTPR